MLKKIVLFVAILLSLVISVGKIAYASASTETWVRILNDNVYLFATEDAKQELFVLEKSYYAQIVGETDTMFQVAVMPETDHEFVQIVAWVKKTDVSTCSAPVDPCYPTVKLTVTADSADLKLSPVPSSQAGIAVLNMQQVCYYGSITSYGKLWYYVRYAGRFGYVEASATTSPNVPLHPTPLPSKPANTTPSKPSDTTPDPSATETNSPASEILLVVFVVVLAVGLTLALFLPGNVKRSNVFEQDI